MKRKEILPVWIQLFSWFFLLFAISPIFFIFGLFVEGNYHIGGFGLDYNGSHTRNIVPLLITSLLTMASVVAYGLLWGKNWAIHLGIAYSILALIASLSSTTIQLVNGNIRFNLEWVLIIPFVITLLRKRKEWIDYPQNAQQVVQENRSR